MRFGAAVVLASLVLVGCSPDEPPTSAQTAPSTADPASSSTATSATTATAAPLTTSSTAPPPALGLGRFQTPTGNIACAMVDPAEQGGGVRCDIADKVWAPPPKPADCELDWGGGLSLDGDDVARVVCAGDTTLDPSLPKLAYGQTSRVGSVACVSRTDGLTCTSDRTGHGFFLSRQSYRLF